MPKAGDIWAWTYEADVHCTECAQARFGAEALAEDTAEDREGNQVHPVFESDEWDDDTVVCGTCGTVIREAEGMTLYERIAEATARGKRAGEYVASWVFDGNTSEETYRAVLKGIEDGDPMLLDQFSPPDLSGEWAGESIPELLGDLLEDDDESPVSDEERQEIEQAWEEAAQTAFWDAIESTAREQVAYFDAQQED